MFRIIIALVWLALAFPCQAQMTTLGAGGVKAAASGTCSQATTLLARMDGSQNSSAVTTLVCGMVTDGTWGKLDLLYVFAINSSANALLNWPNATYNATNPDSLTFTANQGYTGSLTAQALRTPWIPSSNGVNYTQNNAGTGVCVLTSRTSDQTFTEYGANNASSYLYFRPLNASGNVEYGVNDGSFSTFANAGGNAKGAYASNRTSSSTITVYKSGSSIGSTSSATSTTPPTVAVFILAYNVGGTPTAQSDDQVAYFFAGGSFSATDIANIQSRLSTYLTAVSAPSGC